MKKQFIIIVLALILAMVLSACGCAHETWNEATCNLPKTCVNCGKTEGEALGHEWAEATCDAPKTCGTCKATEGDALGHNWSEATCETPKTCSVCNNAEGEALGHAWEEATTETPKTCATCAVTEGERVITDERFTTATTKEIQGKWAYELPVTGEEMGLEGFEKVLVTRLIMDFKFDGTMEMYMDISNEDEFRTALIEYMTEATYLEFEAEGVSREDADAAVKSSYGMTLEEYAKLTVDMIDFNSLLGAINFDGVYYVNNGSIYLGITWMDNMDPSKYTIEGDSLILEGDLAGTGEENTAFKRIAE